MKFSCQQDGKVGSPNTHLPNRNNKSNKQLQLRKQQKSYRAQKLKTATQKIGSISPAWPHSPVQNSSAWKGIPSKGFHPMGKKKKKKRTEEPQQVLSLPWTSAAFVTMDPIVFSNAEPSWQSCSEFWLHLLSRAGAVIEVRDLFPEPQLLLCPTLWNWDTIMPCHLWD